MRFHRAARHAEPTRNFVVFASLQQEIDDLLFARAELNSLLNHPFSPSFRHGFRRLAVRDCEVLDGSSIRHSMQHANPPPDSVKGDPGNFHNFR
jgi:hypothetical protein